jgi:hypothetical protein
MSPIPQSPRHPYNSPALVHTAASSASSLVEGAAASTSGSPAWSLPSYKTPLHVPNLLSPLPPTPKVGSSHRGEEFGSDSEMSDGTFATPKRMGAIAEKMKKKKKPVYATGRLPEKSSSSSEMKEREMISGSDWSGSSIMETSLPKLSTAPARTSAAKSLSSSLRSESDKVKVTLNQVPPPSSYGTSSWEVKKKKDNEMAVTNKENPVNQQVDKKSAMKLDKVVLNLKKTTGNSWNVSSASETEAESASLPDPVAEKKRLKAQRRGKNTKRPPMKTNLRQDAAAATASTAKEEESAIVMPAERDIKLPTPAVQTESLPKTAPDQVVPSKQPEVELSVSKSPAKVPLSTLASKPTSMTKPAVSAGKRLRTYSRKKNVSQKELQSLSNRVAMHTGIDVKISVDFTGETNGADSGCGGVFAAGLDSCSHGLDSGCLSPDQSFFDMSEIAEMSRKAMVSEEEQVINLKHFYTNAYICIT